jgi:hypothetical protein
MAEPIEWFEFGTLDKKTRVAKWKRTIGLRPDGRVLIPAIFASEKEVFLCASYDGQRVVFADHHLYVDLDWAAATWTKTADAELFEAMRGLAADVKAGAKHDAVATDPGGSA